MYMHILLLGEHMRYSELCGKQVVNIKSGKVIGRIVDLCFFEKNYTIKEFYASQPPRCVQRILPWFFGSEEIVIKVDEIINIGEDIVLVQIP